MFITRSSQLTRTLSLSCIGCDAGTDLDSPEHALAAGWSGICEDFCGSSWNYLGTCPDCLNAVPMTEAVSAPPSLPGA